MRIAILGGGHGSYAAAADLAEKGHEIRLWRRDAVSLAKLVGGNGIVLTDAKGVRTIHVSLATGDIAKALSGAELILLFSPAFAQEDIARLMAPHLRDGQVAFLAPGTFGSFVMSEIVRASGNKADVTYAETGTLPYLARKHGDADVTITSRATRLPTGVYPERNAGFAIGVCRCAFAAIEPCGNALSGALMNAGPIIHPPLIMMNAGPLQHFSEWDIHNEGTQPAIRSVTDKLDAERISVREKLGYGAPHFPLSDHYNSDQWMYGDVHKDVTDSGDWREFIDLHSHRYMTEDTEIGLAFLVSVANWAGLEVPVAAGILALAGAITGKDLVRGARTFPRIGIANLSAADLEALLRDGRS